MQFDAKDIPIAVGGVVVYPEDLSVADEDGVIVVPNKLIYDVAKYANQELSADKKLRKSLYETLGMELDSTVL